MTSVLTLGLGPVRQARILPIRLYAALNEPARMQSQASAARKTEKREQLMETAPDRGIRGLSRLLLKRSGVERPRIRPVSP